MPKDVQDGIGRGIKVIQDGIMIKPLITVIESGKTELVPEYPLLVEDFDWKDEFGFWKVFGEDFKGWGFEIDGIILNKIFNEDFSGWE